MKHRFISFASGLGLTLLAAAAHAAVTPEEAAKLKGELTPLGAEKAGNKEGTIPAWTSTVSLPAGAAAHPSDPFKDEKPLFSISSKNVDQYGDKLTDGTKAMLKKYPEYRIDIYPTRRTGIAPQYVYDNTFKNATRGKLVDDYPDEVVGGIPFPIPKSGEEVMWNHNLRWFGVAHAVTIHGYQITADGKPIFTTEARLEEQYPYYYPDMTLAEYEKKREFSFIRLVNSAPAIRAGEAITARKVTSSRGDSAWVYLQGQRRVRKLPNPCCDTPTPATAGLMSFDEIDVFGAQTDRFDWKLLGKKEIYIPYNNNRTMTTDNVNEILGKHYINPDYARWELHRVWVVEATVREGKRHQAPKGRYYCDEDTWTCVLADRWDANGQLWKSVWAYNFYSPEKPGLEKQMFGYNDFLSGTAFVSGPMSDFTFRKPIPDSTFSPEGLTGGSLR